MLTYGKLYLLPVPISDYEALSHIPEQNKAIVKTLRYFIAENAKTARAHLKLFGYETIQQAEIEELNQHSDDKHFDSFLQPLLQGNDIGLMSEAGCPAIADPGASIVKLAHQKGIEVCPLSGPSSIVLSIMASGFNGQNFAFVGYLPLDKNLKIKKIKELEQLAIRHQQAQFFIETPYRNDQLFEILLQTMAPTSMLFIGKELTGKSAFVKSLSIANWKKSAQPKLHKIPVVFGIYGA